MRGTDPASAGRTAGSAARAEDEERPVRRLPGAAAEPGSARAYEMPMITDRGGLGTLTAAAAELLAERRDPPRR